MTTTQTLDPNSREALYAEAQRLSGYRYTVRKIGHEVRAAVLERPPGRL